MKTNYDEYFSEEKLSELTDIFQEKFREGLILSGIKDPSNIGDMPEYELKFHTQKAEEYLKEWLYAQGGNMANIRQAINNKDLIKLSEIKFNIGENEYLDLLATLLFTNSSDQNAEIVKFLLTETELAECSRLKAGILHSFSNSESVWNDEIITLLLKDNELAHETFFEETHNLLCNSDISDQFLIKYFKYLPDINQPLNMQVSRDKVTFCNEQSSLLMRSIQNNRTELTKWLIAEGADVNWGLTCAEGTKSAVYTNVNVTSEIFELLVASKRLVKDSHMNYFQVSLGNQMLNLGDCYEFFTWKNNFQDKLSSKIVSFKNWLSNGIHNLNDFLNSSKSLLSISIFTFKDETLKDLQREHSHEITETLASTSGVIAELKKSFIENWQQTFLICKSLETHDAFCITDIKFLIGQELFNSHLSDAFSIQFLEVLGAEAQLEDFDV